MNEIVKIYKNSPIRIVEKDGEPWFVAKDVCNILEIKNSRDTLNKCLDEDERGVDIIYTPGGNQEMTIVSEAGLYSLILRSRKPEAKAFKRWVTHEVLPSIRKTGAYLSPGMSNEQVKERKCIGGFRRKTVWRNWRLMPRSWRDRPFRQHPLENFLRKPADRAPVWFGITSGALRK